MEALSEGLLAWYDTEARDLPWRKDQDPYKIWVSEVMLQQTQVETVIPYFHRFLEAYPSPGDLAAASEGEVLKLWEGLGYYGRARRLHQGARELVRQGGSWPQSAKEWERLPGIGPYTAGAIASIAFGERVPAPDGNAYRVAARLLCYEEDLQRSSSRRYLTSALARWVPAKRPGDFNQAVMDLGATLCLPWGQPACQRCPLQTFCLAHSRGMTDRIPPVGQIRERKIEERTVFFASQGGRIAVRRRPDRGLLAGLWEFPNVEGKPAEDSLGALGPIQTLGQARHVFTHLEWHMEGLAFDILPGQLPEDWLLVDPSSLERDYALPVAFRTLYRRWKGAVWQEGGKA